MNLSSVTATVKSTASVTPNDATATGDFQLGLASSSRSSLAGVNQMFAVTLTGVSDVSVDLVSGVATVTAGNFAGGDGKDADGVAIALSELGVVHVRNTGLTDILVGVPSLDGDLDVVSAFRLRPQGEFFFQSQRAVVDGTLTLDPAEVAEVISADVVVMGKL